MASGLAVLSTCLFSASLSLLSVHISHLHMAENKTSEPDLTRRTFRTWLAWTAFKECRFPRAPLRREHENNEHLSEGGSAGLREHRTGLLVENLLKVSLRGDTQPLPGQSPSSACPGRVHLHCDCWISSFLSGGFYCNRPSLVPPCPQREDNGSRTASRSRILGVSLIMRLCRPVLLDLPWGMSQWTHCKLNMH